MREGWEGWDEYAPFYDWENARTLGRRDIPFWRRLAGRARGRVLELGCGTGRVSWPLARSGVPLVGVDRSAPMLDRARQKHAVPHRAARPGSDAATQPPSPARAPRSVSVVNAPRFVRADIRHLPFRSRSFSLVLAPYGILQSMLADDDLDAVLRSVGRVLGAGGTLAMELVPDVPNWRASGNRVQLQGSTADGGHLTLIESVRQNRRRGLTTFHERFVEQSANGRQDTRFDLTFRTLSVPRMTDRLERAGFRVHTTLGDYAGGPWSPGSDAWIIVAHRHRS
jgi:SAM-dependent methyltransferase